MQWPEASTDMANGTQRDCGKSGKHRRVRWGTAAGRKGQGRHARTISQQDFTNAPQVRGFCSSSSLSKCIRMEANNSLIQWGATAWCYEGNTVAWADCSRPKTMCGIQPTRVRRGRPHAEIRSWTRQTSQQFIKSLQGLSCILANVRSTWKSKNWQTKYIKLIDFPRGYRFYGHWCIIKNTKPNGRGQKLLFIALQSYVRIE